MPDAVLNILCVFGDKDRLWLLPIESHRISTFGSKLYFETRCKALNRFAGSFLSSPLWFGLLQEQKIVNHRYTFMYSIVTEVWQRQPVFLLKPQADK